MKALYIDNIIKRNTNPVFTQVLLEKGFSVGIAANFSKIDSSLKNNSIAYHHIDFVRNPFCFQNIKAYKQLLKLLKEEKYDVIHCNSPIGGVLGRLCGKIAKVPKIIYTAHGFHFYKGAPLINRTLFKWAEMVLAHFTDIIITINKEDYQAAQKFKLRNNGKVYYIPGIGIDTSSIKQANPKREEILKSIGASHDSIILISVGELNKNKNNEVIIKALGKFKNLKIHYLLCGLGDKKDELYTLAKDYGLEKNVHFFGYRTDIPELLKSCDIFVMPSYREGLSRSLMEAMSAGLPCVVSKIRGNVDLIENGKGGYLCNPNNINEFAKSIKKLSNSTSIRNIMRINNLNLITNFSIENVKKEIKNIYETI